MSEETKTPLISVITLTYRNFDNIYDTINSVMSQNYGNFEYIISDDGSDNFPMQEISSFVDSKKNPGIKELKIIDNKKNVGTVKHINNVLKVCKGEYFVFLTGNDLFVNNTMLSQIVSVLIKEQCDVLICGRIVYKNDTLTEIIPHVKDWKRIRTLNTKEKMYSALMRTEHYGMFLGANTIYKRSAIEEIGFFDEKYVLLEDIPMLATMIWNNKVVLKPELIAIIYEGSTGVSAKQSKNSLLGKDIQNFNQFGKLEHFDKLDRKTKKHILFGVKRAEAKSKIGFILVCLRYSPRIISYTLYNICRKVCGIGEKKYIRSMIDSINLLEGKLKLK